MICNLNNQLYNQTLNVTTDFQKYEICDVSVTLMTSCVGDVSEILRKQCSGCLHFSKYKVHSNDSIFVKFTDNVPRSLRLNIKHTITQN